MNNYDIGGGRHTDAHDDISAVNDITANKKLTNKKLEIASTSTSTGAISAPDIHTKTQVDNLFRQGKFI